MTSSVKERRGCIPGVELALEPDLELELDIVGTDETESEVESCCIGLELLEGLDPAGVVGI
jgi:hypothetical protein